MPLLLLLFVCSGACGLAYQVLWLRQLSHVFGVTAYAASTVLAAFMAGLALGSWLAGPILARIRRPLRAFGIAELSIGLCAITTPVALDLATVFYRLLYQVMPDAFPVQTAARFVSAFVVLMVPTVLMGLTLPLLSASSLVRGPRFPARISALYAANTAGAVGGAMLTGFVLIGSLGMQRTFLITATLNALVGVVAIVLDRRLQASEASATSAVDSPTLSKSSIAEPPRAPRIVWIAMAASGFGSLALEVVWFRVMTLYLDATTYAFTVTLVVVLTGIALGGALASRLLTGERDWLAWLSAIQVATGVTVLLGIGLITWSSPGIDGTRPLYRVSLGLLLPSLLLGVSFPVLLKLGLPASRGTDDSNRGKLVGRFYGVNVLGAIAGSLAGGFLLLPTIGTRLSIIVLAGLFVATGLALSALHPRRRRVTVLATAGLAAFTTLTPLIPDPFVASTRNRIGLGASEIFRDEGVQMAVSVHADQFQRTLRVGGLHQANDSAGTVALHRRIGLLPMALHPAPARALVIGLGGGATAGAVSQHAGTSVQIVELSDGVRKAAPFFSHVTYDVLNQPNVRVRVDDGRNFLLLSGEQFDVITADIIQPFHAGAGSLYSREYFELVRKSLRPGGLALQWIGQRDKSHYVLIMRTFLDVFPHATLWLDGELMVGSLEPLALDAAAFRSKLSQPTTRAAFSAVGLDSYEALRGWYTGGPAQMRSFVGEGALLTDDRPQVEYFRSLASNAEPLDVSPLKGDVADVEPK
jgi:spermidine synthase